MLPTRADKVVGSLERRNPNPVGSDAYKYFEIGCAKKLSHLFVTQIIEDALRVWVDRSSSMMRFAGFESQTPPPSQTLRASDFSAAEQSLITSFATLHILRLWHGPTSPTPHHFLMAIERRLNERVHRVAPRLFDDPLIAIIYVHAVNMDPDGPHPFTSCHMRSFMNKDSPLLDDTTLVLTFLGSGINAKRVLSFASERVRSQGHFMTALITWLGAPALKCIHHTLLDNPNMDACMRISYAAYAVNIHKQLGYVPQWLLSYDTAMHTIVDMCDVEAWLAV